MMVWRKRTRKQNQTHRSCRSGNYCLVISVRKQANWHLQWSWRGVLLWRNTMLWLRHCTERTSAKYVPFLTLDKILKNFESEMEFIIIFGVVLNKVQGTFRWGGKGRGRDRMGRRVQVLQQCPCCAVLFCTAAHLRVPVCVAWCGVVVWSLAEARQYKWIHFNSVLFSSIEFSSPQEIFNFLFILKTEKQRKTKQHDCFLMWNFGDVVNIL